MSDAFCGEIRMFSGTYAPVNWAQCDGAILDLTDEYIPLYALIGLTYGGTYNVNFGLPDLRGRIPINQGSGKKLTPRSLGEKFGTETITLTDDQNPYHTHAIQASTDAATTNEPSTDVMLAAAISPDAIYASTTDTSKLRQLASNAMTSSCGGSDGSAEPHSNMMPALCVNFIICLIGLYPERP